MRLLSLVLSVVLVASAVAVGGAVAGTDAATESSAVRADVGSYEVVVETTFSLENTDGDEIRVIKEYQIGSDVQALEKTISYPVDDVSTRNMHRNGDTFEWDGSGDTARIEYVAAAEDLGPAGVETVRGDDYAVVGATYDGLKTNADRHRTVVSVDGEGTAGDRFALLGGYEEYTREGPEVQYRVVVPDHVDLGENESTATTAETVLDAIEHTDRQLDVGVDRDGEATYFSVDTGLGPNAGRAFQTYGSSNAPGDVLMYGLSPLVASHEAVHQLKQTHRNEDSARWTTEATAQYYAYLLMWQDGYLDFENFGNGFQLVTAPDDEQLDAPGSWGSEMTPYNRGGRVTAKLDREIRAATDGKRTYEDVLRRMNAHDGALTHEEYVDIVVDVGGPGLEDVVDRFVTTDAVPSEPSKPYAYTNPGFDSELSFAAAGSNDSDVELGGRYPRLEVTLENDGSDPATAVGFDVSIPEDWHLLGIAKTAKGAQYQKTDPVPGADIGYFSVPAHNSTEFTVYLQRPDDRSPGTYDYELSVRDLSGQSTSRAGTITVDPNTESTGDAEDSDSSDSESELAAGKPPSSAVDISIAEGDVDGQTTVENRTLPVVNRGSTVNVTMALDNETYPVYNYVFQPITGPSSRSANGTFTYTADGLNVETWGAYVNLENGNEVQRPLRVVVNPAPNVYVEQVSSSRTAVTLGVAAPNEDGDLSVTWLVDGEQVGTGETYRAERADESYMVTAVVEDEYGATGEGKQLVNSSPSGLGVGSLLDAVSGVPLWLLASGLLVVSIVVSWVRNH